MRLPWVHRPVCEDSEAYRRGAQDALAAVLLLLDPGDPGHDRLRAEVTARLRMVAR